MHKRSRQLTSRSDLTPTLTSLDALLSARCRRPRSPTNHQAYPRWHLNYYSEETITALLKQTGFCPDAISVKERNQPWAPMLVVAQRSQEQRGV
jgi:hypothetical protein